MKLLRNILIILLFVFGLLNLFLLLTNNSHIYKALALTYLKGRTGPDIDDYKEFPVRTIAAGTAQPWPRGVDYNAIRIPASYMPSITRLGTVALLVVKNDSLRHEQYWEGYDEQSLSNSFSMAKTFVSILAGIALEEGKIKSIDQALGELIPEFGSGENASLTIRHLLTMSSGLNFDEDYKSPFAYPAKAYYGADVEKLTLSYKVVQPPGKTFDYLSGNTILLAMAIERAVGMSISEYASEKLWKPIGASHNALWMLDQADGMEKAYCCFNSNAPDFARIGQLFLKKGNWKGTRVLSETFVNESVKPAPLNETDGTPNQRYGYSWWLAKHNGHSIFYARGILGQYIIVIPEEDLVLVRLGHQRDESSDGLHPDDFYKYVDLALEMYGKNPGKK